ncbi:MAG: hypothetical protein WBJ81_07220 [Rickettsiales bacterium]
MNLSILNIETEEQETPNFKSKENELWKAVIYQALEDLRLPPSNKRYRTSRKQAKKWFIDEDKDFCKVCDYAGLDPKYVLKEAQKLIKQNF